MTWMNIELPLYEEEDFSYSVDLEGSVYNLRIYFNRRMQKWFLDLSTEDGVEVISGIGLVNYYPIISGYHFQDLTGFFWLQPKSIPVDEQPTVDLINYFELFYVWEE